MGEQTKIRPESIVITKNPSFMDGTSDGLTQIDIAKMRSPLKNAPSPLTISGETSEGKPFKAEGGTSDTNGLKTAKITNYKVGNMDYKLSEPLEVKFENGRLHKDSVVNFEELINKGSTSTGQFLSKKTIRSQYVSEKVSSLDNSEAMKTAMAQANQHDPDFTSAFKNVPGKQQNNNKGLS